MATHNRIELTKRCLNSLSGFFGKEVVVAVFLVDAGSSDGTAAISSNLQMPIRVIHGHDSWYWSKAMSVGQNVVLENFSSDFDFILWLNDDVMLYQNLEFDWVSILLAYQNEILVGQLSENDTLSMSYGGLKRYDRHPLHFEKIFYPTSFGKLDTFAGNFVLIPIQIARNALLSEILSLYPHLYADIDYGLTAKKLHISIKAIPGFVGLCSNDHPEVTPRSLLARFSEFRNPKTLYFRSQIVFLRRHAKYTWPLFVLLPIVRAIVGAPSRYSTPKISN